MRGDRQRQVQEVDGKHKVSESEGGNITKSCAQMKVIISYLFHGRYNNKFNIFAASIWLGCNAGNRCLINAGQ